MSRRHKHQPPPQPPENLCKKLNVWLTPIMQNFLEVEAKRLTERTGKKTSAQEVVRALITAYYEKRMAGLLVNPDD